MSAFKKFNRQDVYVTAYSAKKSWLASGSVISDYGIEIVRGVSGSSPNFLNPEDLYSNRYETLTWQSIYQLYYRGFIQESANSGSYEHYLQSSFTTGSRVISDEIGLVSVPRNVVGTHIQPSTFVLDFQSSSIDEYVTHDYSRDNLDGSNLYIENVDTIFGSVFNPGGIEDYIDDEGDYVLETAAAGGEYLDVPSVQYRHEIVDDGAGRLFFSSSLSGSGAVTTVNVGDIIYTQGQVVLTNSDVARYYTRYLRPVLKWKSNQPIYTYNYNCKVKDSELIYSLNPSAMSGSDGKIADNISGSYFKPYVTSIGLYNDAQELVAVAKLGQPVPKSKDTDMTFVVTLDM